MDKEPCFAVSNDFRDTAGSTAHYRKGACHCLKVHDAQRLINARADKSIAAVFQSIEFRPGKHLFYPDDIPAFTVEVCKCFADFRHDLRGIRRTCTQDDLDVLVDQRQGFEQVRKAFLAGYPPDEKQCRL